MSYPWEKPIAGAFAYLRESQRSFSDLVKSLYNLKAHRIADGLNSEFKSLLFSSKACELIEVGVLERVRDGNHDNYELRHLNFTFGTDAVLSAYNALMIVKSPEFCSIIGDHRQNEFVELFHELIPKVIEASDALRHHHDRMFGRVRKKIFNKPEQYVGQLGAYIRLTDENLDVFVFEFNSEQILRLIAGLSSLAGDAKCG